MQKRCSYSWDRLLHPRGPQCNVTRCSPQGINNNENHNMQYCVSQNYRLSTDVFLSTHNTTDNDRNVWYSSFTLLWFAAACKPAGVSNASRTNLCGVVPLYWTQLDAGPVRALRLLCSNFEIIWRYLNFSNLYFPKPRLCQIYGYGKSNNLFPLWYQQF